MWDHSTIVTIKNEKPTEKNLKYVWKECKILNIENLAEVSSLENLETFIIVKALHELNINKF